MKKFLAMLLAVSMVASMSAVSFALDSKFLIPDGKYDKISPAEAYRQLVGTDGKYDDDDGYPIDTTLIGPFGYDTDDKAMILEPVQYGKTAYFLLTEYYDSGSPRLVTNSDTAKNLKVKGDWEEGKSLVDGLSITKKKISGFGTYNDDDKDDVEFDTDFASDMHEEYGFAANKYYYMVALTVEDSTSTADADIIGTLTLSKSKKPKADDIDFDVAVNVDWEQSYRKNEEEWVIDGDRDLKSDTYYALKFDYDDEVEFTFDDDSTFTVDVSGQSKILFYYDTDFNSSIAAKYPLAELNFWNGNGAKFNRTGEMFLSTGDDFDEPYLYQVNSDGSLSEVANAEYDDADEGFYFKTRTLGSYVYSDMELDTSATESSDESDDIVVTPVDPVTPVNPGTGARA